VRKVQPAYKQISDQLRDLIMLGRLKPGEQLPSESQLATNFGVSRNTTREALRILASQGLIDTQRGVAGGSFVAHPDKVALQASIENGIGLLSGEEPMTSEELLEARLILELPAARHAAERRTQADLDRIRIASTRVEHGREVAERADHSVDFHQAVMEAAGNRLMSLIAPPVWRVFARCAVATGGSPHTWQQIDHDHSEILRCIECRDADGAEKAMRCHLERLRETSGLPSRGLRFKGKRTDQI
jgi:DNA-binding FadR family transcriptional regulator